MKDNLKDAAGTEVTFKIPDVTQLAQLEHYDEVFNLTVKYRGMDEWPEYKDIPIRAFFMGTKTIPNDKGEKVVYALFVTEKECFMAAQMILVDAVKNLAIETPVVIIYGGKNKNKSSEGSTMKFDVIQLGR